jgi:hypothetical protein
VGTCQDSVQGESICCAANCGDCKQCAATGNSCTDLVETRPGCECEPNDTSNCVDGIACTDDECVNGQCENPVSAGSCLIAGQCVTRATLASSATRSSNPPAGAARVQRCRATTIFGATARILAPATVFAATNTLAGTGARRLGPVHYRPATSRVIRASRPKVSNAVPRRNSSARTLPVEVMFKCAPT